MRTHYALSETFFHFDSFTFDSELCGREVTRYLRSGYADRLVRSSILVLSLMATFGETCITSA